MESVDEEKTQSQKILSMLQCGNDPETVWEETGGLRVLHTPEILLLKLREYENGPDKARLQLEGEKALEEEVRVLPTPAQPSSTSHRSGHQEQQSREHTDIVQALSRLLAYACETTWQEDRWENGIPRVANGVDRLKNRVQAIGNGQVPHVAALAWEILTREG